MDKLFEKYPNMSEVFECQFPEYNKKKAVFKHMTSNGIICFNIRRRLFTYDTGLVPTMSSHISSINKKHVYDGNYRYELYEFNGDDSITIEQLGWNVKQIGEDINVKDALYLRVKCENQYKYVNEDVTYKYVNEYVTYKWVNGLECRLYNDNTYTIAKDGDIISIFSGTWKYDYGNKTSVYIRNNNDLIIVNMACGIRTSMIVISYNKYSYDPNKLK